MVFYKIENASGLNKIASFQLENLIFNAINACEINKKKIIYKYFPLSFVFSTS